MIINIKVISNHFRLFKTHYEGVVGKGETFDWEFKGLVFGEEKDEFQTLEVGGPGFLKLD